MKKFAVSLICLLLTLACATCALAVDFDPSQYSKEELNEIVDIIWREVPKQLDSENEVVLMDEQGIYIAFRGFVNPTGSPRIYLFIDNNSDMDISISTSDYYANRAQLQPSNANCKVSKGMIYSSKPNYDFYMYGLPDYDITVVKQFDFKLTVYKADGYVKLFEKKVSLQVDIPLTE